MFVNSVQNEKFTPAFGVVRGNRVGFNRLYRSLGADTARQFIKSQKKIKQSE